MTDKEKVLKGLECCRVTKCEECPYRKTIGCITNGLVKSTLELLKNEPNAPAENAPSASTEDTAYQRLMEIYRDLIERNTKLAEEAQKLARFNDHLTALCEALMKKVYADEKS